MTDIIEKQIVSNTYMREDTGGGAMDCGIVNRSLNILNIGHYSTLIVCHRTVSDEP